MAEWKPVVGGRAMLHGEPCLVMALTSDARAEVGRVGWGLRPLVPLSDLTEHPDDARHRRLLEAARDLVNCGYDLQTVTRLQSAVQAIDQAEADHAS